MTDDGQLELVPAGRRARPARADESVEPASERPVAHLVVDTPLAHLDRLFDYAVPSALDADVALGCRVKVRFAGRLTDAFVVGRDDDSTHEGTLAPIVKVVSPEPVLTPDTLGLCRAVADRWAGTLPDVLRLAVPPRQARVEAKPSVPPASPLPDLVDVTWQPWPDGPGFVAALAAGASPRASWSALPHRDPARAVAEAVLATVHSGRGAVVCVPDARDLAHWDAVFAEVLGPGRHVLLTAGEKPAARYRAYLAASRGAVPVVLGTRSAALAPVARLGLVAIWDDGDDSYAEPRAPYPHAREVLLMRAARHGAGVLVAGFARTAEAQSLIASGWCIDLAADPTTRRRAWPQVEVTDGTADGSAPARLPREVFSAVRSSQGPVLVQVPRRGYRTSLACQHCRAPARCRACEGPLVQTGRDATVTCRWCGTSAAPWTCGECGSGRLRAPVVGQLRTAEEYAAAFPSRTIVTSGGASVLDEAEGDDVLVLATPGAEPRVAGGYDVVVLMDTWLALTRDDVRVEEEAHRRWFNALALGRERRRAVVVGDPQALQALVRVDPVGLAERELETRAQTHLPPVGRLAVVEGPPDVVAELAERAWPAAAEVLGPVPAPDASLAQLVLRVPRRDGADLSERLRAIAAQRSAGKLPPLRIRVDPHRF